MNTDNNIYTDIIEKLEFEPMITSSQITIAVHNGIVTLDGIVSSYTEKKSVERAVSSINGVKGIANELRVDLLEHFKRSDADIAKAAIDSINWHVLVPEGRIKVIVENGLITLTGTVDWWYQQKMAEKCVKNLMGIKGVNNQIVVKPMINPEKVKEKIEKEFERNAEIDAENIRIETVGNKVILHGKVRSWAEIQEATRAVWSVPGVSQVENFLTV